MTRAVGSALALVALLVSQSGCLHRTPPRPISWRTLARGLISGIAAPRQTVFHSEADYLKAWAEHAASSRHIALPPPVDFQREMVLLVALGNQPTGGHTIEIVDAKLRKRTLTVLVGVSHPAPGDLQIQQATQPVQFVALPTMQAKIRFRTVHPSHTRPLPPEPSPSSPRIRPRIVPAPARPTPTPP